MSGVMRQVAPGCFVQDKSTQARQQSAELCRAILAAQPKPVVPKTAGQYSRESAKCFRQAVHLACCALKCWLKCFCKNLPNQLNFFRLVFQRQSKYADSDSCAKSDAKNEVLSNAEKVDGNQLISDALNPCQNPQKSDSPSGADTKNACFSKPATKPARHHSEGGLL